MRFHLLIFLLFGVVILNACHSKKLNLRSDYTVLSENLMSTPIVGKGILSGYLYRRSDNQTPKDIDLTLENPPLEKIYLVEINEDGYFEIELSEGAYTFTIRRKEDVLLKSKSMKIREGKKLELLIYLNE